MGIFRPRVYPRPRGGTAVGSVTMLVPEGLSPPTRGNLRMVTGIIAAGYGLSPPTRGNRCRTASTGTSSRVYPRPRGGTATIHLFRGREAPSGSIPAHAGEPLAS